MKWLLIISGSLQILSAFIHDSSWSGLISAIAYLILVLEYIRNDSTK